MRKGTLLIAVVSAVLLAAPTVLAQTDKPQLAVYVKGGGNAAVNTVLVKPLETAFAQSGKFGAERSKPFLGDAAKLGKTPDNARIAELGRQHGVRFICVIDIANVKVRLPANLTGSATISILDATAGRTIGAPQTLAMPPSNIAQVGKQLVTLAATAAVDAVASAPAAGATSAPAVSTAISQSQPQPRRENPRLAIVPVRADAERSNEAENINALIQILRIALANTGKYTVLPPHTSEIRAALDELNAQKPDHVSEDKIKAIGAATNAEHVLRINIRNLGNLSMLIMEIFSAEDGSLIAGEILNFRAIEEAAEGLPEVAGKLAGKIRMPEAEVAAVVVPTPAAVVQEVEAEPVLEAVPEESAPMPVEEHPLGEMRSGTSFGIRAGVGFGGYFEETLEWKRASSSSTIQEDVIPGGWSFDAGIVTSTRLSNRFAINSGINVKHRRLDLNADIGSYDNALTEWFLSIPVLLHKDIFLAVIANKDDIRKAFREGRDIGNIRTRTERFMYWQLGFSVNWTMSYDLNVDRLVPQGAYDIKLKGRSEFFMGAVLGTGLYLTRDLLLNMDIPVSFLGGGGFESIMGLTYFVHRPR